MLRSLVIVAAMLLTACEYQEEAEHKLGPGAVCEGENHIYQCVKDGRPWTCVYRDARIECYQGVAPGITHKDTTVIMTGN